MEDMHKYVKATHGFEDELKATLTSAELESLHQDMKQIGVKAWVVWEIKHLDEISAFLSATPAQREKRKAWQDLEIKSRLVLGAIRLVLSGRLMLNALNNPYLHPNGSYRSTVAGAGNAYSDLLDEYLPYWPLDGESPFEVD